MRLGSAAGLAHSDDQSGGKAIVKGSQNCTHAVGINVVKEVKWQPTAMRLKGFDHQQRAQTAATDADPENIGERLSTGRFDDPTEHIPTELFNPINFSSDVITDRVTGRQLRGTQPVVPHLALLIRIGDRTGFEFCHGRKGLIEFRLQLFEVSWIEMHAADVQPDAEILVVPKEIAESLPLSLSVTGTEIREAHRALMVHTDRRYPGSSRHAHPLGHPG